MKKFIRRDLRDIPRNEENKLVDAIIEIAYIIQNSGIIVGEKLKMPDSILFEIRLISSRASGYANPKKFINRNLEEISPKEMNYHQLIAGGFCHAGYSPALRAAVLAAQSG